MNITAIENNEVPVNIEQVEIRKSKGSFLQANTEEVELSHLKKDCIIPVFAKDNESTISHNEFITSMREVAESFFGSDKVLEPAIRVSHPIKGRIPEAMGKPAKMLEDFEKTIYYERMAFMLEIPSITESVDNNKISLCMGGVRAYNQENLHNKKSEERFKVFIGFKNWVCTNLCISTDGYVEDLKARDIVEVAAKIYELISNFDGATQIKTMRNYQNYELTDRQFAHLIGKSRMYHYLPSAMKSGIESFPVSDTQISMITKEYYHNDNFSCDNYGGISLWKLFNLFTGANKSSYIDTFLKRGVSTTQFINHIQESLEHQSQSWYIA